MCDKAVDNYDHALEFVPDRCKSQKMYDEVIDDYPSTIQFVSEGYKTQRNV